MIEIKNLCKTYSLTDGSVEALKDVSLSIPDGDVFGIIGMSGAGKSTLIKTLLREEVPTEGEVTVNGRDLIHMKQREIPYFRRTIGVVFQDFRLIPTMTVFDNVAFALQVTGVPRRFIRRRVPYILNLLGLDDKYKHYPPELSGGERQRISIARAMLKDAPIVILDEATSYTDRENEAVIQSALGRLVRGKTLLVIAHRLSTIADADQIIVVNQGKIEATGTQAELLASCPLYQTMWEAHISVKDDGEVA